MRSAKPHLYLVSSASPAPAPRRPPCIKHALPRVADAAFRGALYRALITRTVKTRDGHMLWARQLSRHGYGVLDVKIAGRRYSGLAHRALLLALLGELPAGKLACHRPGCVDRRCIAPGCLYLGDAMSNAADAIATGAQVRGARVASAKFDDRSALLARAFLVGGLSRAGVAWLAGVDVRTVDRLDDGISWTHVSMVVADEPDEPLPPGCVVHDVELQPRRLRATRGARRGR